MSRITGSEVRSMMEAYNAVYAPQITEQQIQEDFENWVYSLVDEGEDLSEYTWDEMYEAYNYINAEQLDEIAPALAAPFVAPAALAAGTALVGGAAKLAQDLQKRRSATKNTPDEERFLSTGSFQSRKNKPGTGQPPTGQTTRVSSPAAKPARKPLEAKPKPETPTGSKPRVTINNTGSPSSPGAGAGGGNQPPKTPEPPKPAPKPPEPPKQPSGGSNKPPGFGEKLKQRMADDATKRVAEREARRARPNAIGQAVQDKAVDLTARGLNKLATGVKRAAVGSGIAGAAGVVDQQLLGGVVGKSARDFTNWTKQAGSEYDKSMGRGKGTTPPPPTAPGRRLIKGLKESPDWNSAPKPKGVAALTLGSETKVFIPGQGWQFPKTARRWARAQGYENWDKIPNPSQPAKPVKPVKPAPDQGQGSRRPGESDKDFAARQSAELQKDYPTTPAPGTTPPRTTPAPGTTSPAATKPAPTSPVATKPSPSKPAIERSPQGYAVGTTAGGTKFERRAATGAELRAAQEARQKALASAPTDTKGAEEAAVKAGVQRSQPTTGPASATVKPAGGTSTLRDMSKYPLKPAPTPTPTATPVPARNGFGASTAGANAAASVSSATAPDVTTSNKIAAMNKQPDVKPQQIKASYEYDAYDLVLEYLLNNGHVDTLDEALYVMMEMDVETIGTIVEGGYNNSTGRYDLGNGQTTGLLGGAIRQILSGNLPKQRTYIPPSPRQGTNTPPAVPPSKDDSGKSTDFGAGGGKAKMKTGMTVGQVERQGRMNKGDYSG